MSHETIIGTTMGVETIYSPHFLKHGECIAITRPQNSFFYFCAIMASSDHVPQTGVQPERVPASSGADPQAPLRLAVHEETIRAGRTVLGRVRRESKHGRGRVSVRRRLPVRREKCGNQKHADTVSSASI